MEHASSRIFIKGLPPTLTEAEVRKIFAQKCEITDAKIFPSRRIGYVGYRTPEDAQRAVKYFNKTFIRMSRIGVELARPPGQDARANTDNEPALLSQRESGGGLHTNQNNVMKRKRDDESKEDQDPKLREFLDVMRPKKMKKAWEVEEMGVPADVQTSQDGTDAGEEGASEEEYGEVPKILARSKQLKDSSLAPPPESEFVPMDAAEEEAHLRPDHDDGETSRPAMSDADWARSRTSRLLGLLDDDEELTVAVDRKDASSSDSVDCVKNLLCATQRTENSMKVPSSEDQQCEPGQYTKTEMDSAQTSTRLFVRNLPYSVTKEDLEAEFEQFGSLEEVSLLSFLFRARLKMNNLIGTTDAIAFDVIQGEFFSRCFPSLNGEQSSYQIRMY